MRAARAARRFKCARRSGPAGLAALVSDPRIRNLWVVMLVTPSKFRSLVCLSISSIAVSGSQGSSAPRPAVPPAAGAARGGNIRPPPRRVKGAGGSPRDAHILRRGPGGPRACAQAEGGPPRPVPGRAPLRAKMPLVGQRRPALPRPSAAVPSALGGLTSGFGTGPGVPPLPWPLTNKGHSAVTGAPPCPQGRTALGRPTPREAALDRAIRVWKRKSSGY